MVAGRAFPCSNTFPAGPGQAMPQIRGSNAKEHGRLELMRITAIVRVTKESGSMLAQAFHVKAWDTLRRISFTVFSKRFGKEGKHAAGHDANQPASHPWRIRHHRAVARPGHEQVGRARQE